MKTHSLLNQRHMLPLLTAAALSFVVVQPQTVSADETCMSPYMAKIVGQEDFDYIWTLGVPGVGDEQDKLVTIDVN
ncbi:MAG TPA: selenium-binding protein, partial [Gammaproteobacteria bacterium]|nr:selenium-binding protein [Gammaproteobacteria bacterium]